MPHTNQGKREWPLASEVQPVHVSHGDPGSDGGVDFPSNVVAPNQLRAMAGNAVPIPLFQRVIEAVLSAAGL